MSRKYYPPYVEYRAVVAVMNVVLRQPSQHLEPVFDFKDKNIAFDGTIEIHKDKNWNKDTRIGGIQVQIKGTSTKPILDGKITYPIFRKDLKIFQQEQGVLFFVVLIDGLNREKVYYNAMTPMDIQSFLSQMEEQDSLTVNFWPLEDGKLESICLKLLRHQEQQPKLLINSGEFLKYQNSVIEIASLTYDPESTTANNLFEHRFQLYGKYNDLTVPIVSSKLHQLARRKKFVFKSTHTSAISLSGEFQWSDEEYTIIISDVFELTIRPNKRKNNISYRFLDFKSLRDQLQVLALLKDFFSGYSLWIDHQEIRIGISNSHVFKEFQEQIDRLLRVANAAAECFKLLNISLDSIIEFDNIGKIYNSLNFVVDILLHQNYTLLDKKLPLIDNLGMRYIRLQIGKQHIGLFDIPNSEPRLKNLFSEDALERIVKAEDIDLGVETTLCIYAIIEPEDLAGCLNFAHTTLRESFEQSIPFNDSLSTELYLEFALKCIHAYDVTKDQEWLQDALYIYSKYPNYNIHSQLIEPTEEDSLMINLNILQIRFRLNMLTENDISFLLETKTIPFKEEPSVHFVIAALLKNKQDMDFAVEYIKKEEWELLSSLPIYEVYNQVSNLK
ncbi:hypothetical protein L2089_15260 [Paenibacillus hunanensis]|uniref:hypothetical protein n=1 Tax=Paenibacillus hunanensis TaxID=539262 RepID=UPI002026300B|nr:hypothetical protein [Paenibacillus hunanensis]MCL9662051.1 hypothetical protein [Paenibacillus hunanensis]